jgi:adenosylhomocysteine nucleosidase
MKYAILVALPEELKDVDNTFYTGVGKVNATITACNVINESKPDMIINYGTAGTVNNKHEGLVQVDTILQRDMMTEPQAPRGVTPFENEKTAGAIMLDTNTDVTLGSGDSFVQEPDDWFKYANVDIVDMEAYGIAKACNKKQVKFLCYKWVSDFADENAMKNWTENINAGQVAFIEKLKEVKQKYGIL